MPIPRIVMFSVVLATAFFPSTVRTQPQTPPNVTLPRETADRLYRFLLNGGTHDAGIGLAHEINRWSEEPLRAAAENKKIDILTIERDKARKEAEEAQKKLNAVATDVPDLPSIR